jgi:very-short-patch-repair endonuclease
MATMRSAAFDTDTVKDAIAAASNAVGETLSQYLAGSLTIGGPYLSRSESPIEAVFWVWWQAVATISMVTRYPHMFVLRQQYDVHLPDGVRYRLDFAVPQYSIAIEVDGHDFHERTKEQVIYRNERDRRLQLAGWTVLHYSGTELLRKPAEVVTAIFERCLAAEATIR